MNTEIIAVIAVLISILSALYARKSVKEASRANDLSRMNALLSFRQHYLELMTHQQDLAQMLQTSPSGLEAVRNTYAELDTKLREVSKEIEGYHAKVIGNKI